MCVGFTSQVSCPKFLLHIIYRWSLCVISLWAIVLLICPAQIISDYSRGTPSPWSAEHDLQVRRNFPDELVTDWIGSRISSGRHYLFAETG